MSKTNNAVNYGLDWGNIDLDSNYQRDQNIIDPLNFDILLLEINCNIPNINSQTVRAQFKEDLNSRIDSAIEIFEANILNIVKHANKKRNEN